MVDKLLWSLLVRIPQVQILSEILIKIVQAEFSQCTYYSINANTDYGHPERAFFQKIETFGLGQTNWAENLRQLVYFKPNY